MPGYDYSEKMNKRLSLWNEIALSVITAVRGLPAKAASAIKHRAERLVRVEFDPRKRVPIGEIRILLSKAVKSPDLRILMYVSSRKWPLTPSSALRIKEELARKVREYHTDTTVILLLPEETKVTRGAMRIFRKEKYHGIRVFVAWGPEDVKELLRKYLQRRFEALRNKLVGKKIWGEVALLALVLVSLLNKLGVQLTNSRGMLLLFDAVLGHAIEIDNLPPP
jgi:hypothetical protein